MLKLVEAITVNKSTNKYNNFLGLLNKNIDFSDNISSLAFKSLLIDKLFSAISDYLEVSGGLSESIEADTSLLTKKSIPLQRIQEIKRVIYVSAIGLKLQKQAQKSPMKIAEAIASSIDLPSNFTIHLLPPGWIQFHINELELAVLLQHLNQWPIQTEVTEKLRNGQTWQHLYSPQDLFLVQYAHARCCSLLRLADRQGAIALSKPRLSAERSAMQIINPNPIPWLDAQNQLHLVHITEWALISRLVTTLDTLSSFTSETPPAQVMKLATCLSQDFLTFYRANRIWGEIKIENLALAQARLGLIRATQTMIKLLLEEGLGVFAPIEM